jgi:hypothetical protein
MAEVLEHLPSKCKVLGSKLTKKEEEEKEEEK